MPSGGLGTLTQWGSSGSEHAVAFLSTRSSHAEEDCTANERELRGLVYLLDRFRCYLEGSEFEDFTDSQSLRSLFSKPSFNRLKARWPDFLGFFGISELTLVKKSVRVLGAALSCALQTVRRDTTSVNNIKIETSAITLPADLSKN